MDSLETQSRDVQERTFCKWLNSKLESQGYPLMTSLVKDLSDGVKLIQLMEIMGDTSLGRFNKVPKMRVQKAENVNKALEFIRSRGVKLTNIGPEDIIDGNLKLILGMIWTLILRFTIADISEEGLSAKEGLLLWCQRKTANYPEVNVVDFGYSWSDGLALCALIHHHRPDLLDYHSLEKADTHRVIQLAFDVAAHHLSIPQLLEVKDLADARPPDERSVMTYVASYFHAFSSMGEYQQETVSRRVEKFAELMHSVWLSKNDYERRIEKLLHQLRDKEQEWLSTPFTGTYEDAKTQSNTFLLYKQTMKRDWVAEKQDLGTLLGNVQTKLKTYNLRPYEPPDGLDLAGLDTAWLCLLECEGKRSRAVNAQIRNIKETLRQTFANEANAYEQQLRKVAADLAALDGPLETQRTQLQAISADLEPLLLRLVTLERAEQDCQSANVEENDHTVFNYQDLQFEFRLLQQAISKKVAFIDNQIVSRNMSNLTPAQLEQFESTFRYFDKDETNTLSMGEMAAALASLGIVYSDEDLETIFTQLGEEYGAVTFAAFVNLLVEITEDQTSPEQLRDAFRSLAGEKGFMTEVDLQQAVLSASAVAYLREVIPLSSDPVDHLDYEMWLDEVFPEPES
ncbi:hypothetical protein DACRYDRAFT_65404 [Dacryopinax primogenitus]|uniref:Actinin-like protein n=1 Tax=Dacryopinax primogenitus (strain DJM 731) TaxID=1858805 RepID=M5GB37_DACPD|nr:uncharacterized protein DACRYDRAFT_65404 [Dacryopinax primogenitus]EJU03207.1 hypothetical protein DACRYDRAFT_65404 [Dacryopinax primogenitus]